MKAPQLKKTTDMTSENQDLLRILRTAIQNSGSVIEVPKHILDTLTRIKVKADGKCLWYSIISAHLIDQDISFERLKELDNTGQLRNLARNLRLSICQEIWDEVRGQFTPTYENFWAPGEEGTESASTPSSYIELLKKGGIYGGQMELLAAATILERNITIFNIACNLDAYIVNIPPPVLNNPKPILLVRHGLHYDALYVKDFHYDTACCTY